MPNGDDRVFVNVYAIYDEKARCYMSPFLAATDGLACRILSDVVRDPNTSLARYPEDYRLYEIGAFDQTHGELQSCLEAHGKNRLVACAVDFIKPQPRTPQLAVVGRGAEVPSADGAIPEDGGLII